MKSYNQVNIFPYPQPFLSFNSLLMKGMGWMNRKESSTSDACLLERKRVDRTVAKLCIENSLHEVIKLDETELTDLLLESSSQR